MIVSEITLSELLKTKLDDKETSAFLSILETRVDKKFEEAKSVLATKEDLAREISSAKLDIIKWVFAMFFTLMLMIVGLYLKH